MTTDETLTALRREAQDAKVRLYEAVQDACPGDHSPVQHRDRLPAWCHACGRDSSGVERKETA